MKFKYWGLIKRDLQMQRRAKMMTYIPHLTLLKLKKYSPSIKTMKCFYMGKGRRYF